MAFGSRDPGEHADRVAWVDYGKGICIIAVVCLYAANYVGAWQGGGWMQYWVDFARPFRMPDFFLLSGLFLARTIDRPWRDYLDKKIIHFAYFFVLWTTIYFVAEAILTDNLQNVGPFWAEYLRWYLEPYHMLWFIAMLPIYFLVTRALRGVPWWIVLPLAAALQILETESGWYLVDRFRERYVYFYAGYAFAPLAFQLTDWARRHRGQAISLLALWAIINETLVLVRLHEEPGVSLALGFAGASAVMMVAALLQGWRAMDWLRYLGQNSIVVFLSFYLPLVAAAKVIRHLGLPLDVGTQALVITIVAIAAPIAFHALTRRSLIRGLFVRPAWAKLDTTAKRPSRVPPLVSTVPNVLGIGERGSPSAAAGADLR
jgi:uncharacterized membrane protein YcfT